jgi:Protein of unknown function (DUF3631)/Bifunctional DNA primase/polymerase, N-terminal
MTSEVNLAVALRLAAAGGFVFPAIVTRNEATKKLDKRPAIGGWREAATTDPERVKRWWATFPEAVPGIELGRSGLFVVDLDRHPGGADGVKAFRELRNGRDLPPQPVTHTPSNGFHLIFRQPAGEPLGNGRGDLPAGVDCRGDGGWIVAPGGTCAHGAWRPVKGRPALVDAYRAGIIPVLPEWLRDIIRPPRPSSPPPSTTAKRQRQRQDGEPREVAWATAALEAMECELANAPAGTRNEGLNKAAHRLGTMVVRNWLERAYVEARLLAACHANGLIRDDGEKSTLATLASGLSAGMAAPHPDLPTPVENKVAELAALSRLEYDRRRKDAAKNLGIKLTTLDREVANLRAQQKPARNFLPHWEVQPWPEKVEGAALLDALRRQFARYVVLPAHADIALALWVAHTWVFECFDITPYVSITSPTRRCGKTVLMTLLYWLSCRGKKSDSMSKAAIYRSVDGEKPTLVLDEVSWVLDLRDERQGILCGGFERNGHVEVCEGEGTAITTRLFSTYCPKAFGLIGKLTPTLTDRSIRIPMRRKLRTERVERLRRRDNEEHARLRQQCLRWVNDNASVLAKAPPAALDALNDRALDFWEPLLIIADLVGGDWPEAARKAALALSGDGEDDATNILLLRDLQWLFDGKPETQDDKSAQREYEPADQLFSRTIIEELAKISTSPWAGWNNGRGFSQHDLARALKDFGVVSETVRIGSSTAKGYYAAKLREPFETYLPAAQPSLRPGSDFENVTASQTNNDGRNLQKSSRHNESFVTDEKSSETRAKWALCRCDVSKTRSGREEEKGSLETVPSDYEAVLEEQATSSNGHTVWPRAISNSPEDRQEPPPDEVFAKVVIREIWPPALGPEGDDVFDLAPPRWRQ